jgi:hypothetical protein
MKIDQNNVSAYLRYINPFLKTPFDDTLIEKWAALNDAQIQEVLNDLYVKLQWSEEQVNNIVHNFLHPRPISTPKEVEITKVAPIPDIITIANPIEDITEIPTYKEPTPIIPIITAPSKATIDTTSNNYSSKTSTANKTNKLGAILLLLVLAIGGYVGYQYMLFQQMGFAYTLTNNVSVRDSPYDDGKSVYRLDLFGTSLNKNGIVENTLQEVKIINATPDNDYLKVQAKASFTDYLFSNKKNTFYVHQNVISTDANEYWRYKEIFKNLKSDYNELDKLQLKYRKIIVDAIQKYPELNGLIVAPTCSIEKKLSNKAPLSIGQYKSKDEFGNIKNLYAIVQLSNNNYYTIVANEMSQVQNIYTTQLSNFGANSPLNQNGKFKYYDPYNFTYGDFIWESCDKQTKAISGTEPFNNFVIVY